MGNETSRSDSGTPPAADWRPNGIVAGGPRSEVSLLRRFCAWLIDWLLCLLVGGALIVDQRYRSISAGIVFIIEYTFFIGLFAQTPGYWIARIRCVSADHGGRLGLARSFARAVLLALILPAWLGWHNSVARSIVEPVERSA